MFAHNSGFTLIELILVVAMIVIISAIAIPNLLASKREANESAAIATLKSIVTSQSQLKASGAIDADQDGTGEFGYFQELSGVRGVRTGQPPKVRETTVRVSPPALSARFGTTVNVSQYGCVLVSGYYFVMVLPAPKRNFAVEPASNTKYPQVDPGNASRTWACYAWPVSYGKTGAAIFYTNQSGIILKSNNHVTRYDGLSKLIDIRGVLLPGKSKINDSLAINAKGNDGNYWVEVK